METVDDQTRWICPEDRGALSRAAGGLNCPQCGRMYELADGIPVFTRDAGADARVRRPVPLLDGLWQSIQREECDAAVAEFCETHACSRHAFSSDWRFFLDLPRPGHLLELGAGFGDDGIAFADRDVTCIVPHLTNARILKHSLEQTGGSARSIAVTAGDPRLPLADGSIDAIAIEDVAFPGFAISVATFDEAASEWKRVLKPGGSVFVGLGHPWRELSWVRRLHSAMVSRRHAESLNRLVKRAAAGPSRRSLGSRRVIAAMRRQGFCAPRIYAPLPDEKQIQLVIPAADGSAVRYFLGHLIRRNSALVRAAIGAGEIAVRLDLFRRILPYSYLFFGLDGRERRENG